MNQQPYFTFETKIWLYQGQAAWHFATVPKPISVSIKDLYGGIKRGFGSIRVRIKCQTETWQTSIFPDSKSGCYLLPIKKSILKKLQLPANQTATFVLEIENSPW